MDTCAPHLLDLRYAEAAERRLHHQRRAAGPAQMRAGGSGEDRRLPADGGADAVAVAFDVLVYGDRAVPDVLGFARHHQAGDEAGLLVIDGEDLLAELGERAPERVAEVPDRPRPA